TPAAHPHLPSFPTRRSSDLFLPSPAFAQSEVVTPNDNLVTDGLPPVPAAIAAAARPYSEFRTAASDASPRTRHEMIIGTRFGDRSEEHTSELQSSGHLVCRL